MCRFVLWMLSLRENTHSTFFFLCFWFVAELPLRVIWPSRSLPLGLQQSGGIRCSSSSGGGRKRKPWSERQKREERQKQRAISKRKDEALPATDGRPAVAARVQWWCSRDHWGSSPVGFLGFQWKWSRRSGSADCQQSQRKGHAGRQQLSNRQSSSGHGRHQLAEKPQA